MLDGRKMWQPRGFGRTDENGEFRIANLPPGNFYLVAEAKAEGSGLPLGFSARAGQAKGYPLTYFPDTFDESSATILHLAGGEEKRANFLMHAVPLYSVSGMVTGVPEGAAASVQFIQAGIPLRGVRFDRTTGKFQMQNIPAGTYTLAAEADNEKGFLHDQKQITVNGDVSNLQLALESGISIPVNVQRIVTRPQEKTEAGPVTGRDRRNLNEADDELPLTIRLWPSPSTLTVGAMGAISSQSASKISIQNVLAGRYSVEAAVESPWYVESIRRGGLDLAKEELVVSAGEQEPMDVVLRDDSATLRGQVHWEGQPTEGGGVLVMPDAGRSPFTITTSPEGKFAQTGVPPGGYRVLPFEDLNAIEYRNREALRPYLPKATHVTLQPNQTTTMELEEIRKEE
jgi:hypothetical protein